MLENIYITIAIVAALMLLDFFLTLKGLRLYKQKYSGFIRVESYELNPMFQKSIRLQRYDFRHLASVVSVCILLFAVHYLGAKGKWGFDLETFFLVQGMLFSIFAYINSRHLQNIMIFNAVNRNPNMLSGKVKQSYLFSLTQGSAHAWAAFLVLFAAYLFQPSSFMLGFALGPLVIAWKSRRWQKKQ